MHESSMLRMQWFKETYLDHWDKKEPVSVLDVGSQCVLGQADSYKTIIALSPGSTRFNYTGLDMEQGENVDIAVKNAYRWTEVPDDSYDVVISGQMFEHVEFPWFTISEMARVLKPGGLMCVIVPSMQRLHRWPVNCQNYFYDGLIALAKYAGLETLHASTHYAPEGAGIGWYDASIQDSMLVARKSAGWKAGSFDIDNYVLHAADPEKAATGLIPLERQTWYPEHLKRQKRRRVTKLPSRVWKSIVKRNRIQGK